MARWGLPVKSDLEQIAIRWYTEQRGRVVGNTTMWDDLTMGQKINIMDDVEATLDTFRCYYNPVASPQERKAS